MTDDGSPLHIPEVYLYLGLFLFITSLTLDGYGLHFFEAKGTIFTVIGEVNNRRANS
jgi:hypothetical protein